MLRTVAAMITTNQLHDGAPIHVNRRRFLCLGAAVAAGGAVFLAGCGDDDSTDATSTVATNAPDATDATASSPVSTDTAATDATDATAATDATDASTASTATTASDVAGTPATTAFTAADFAALGTCVLLPELTEGPFPTVSQLERRDITEGREGHPLRVGVRVVDEASAAVPGAVVEIWHCDIDGDYSAYADGYTSDDDGPGTTFFRGSQTANADGIVEFLTVYPGWYSGRAVHIHTKIHIGATTVLTSQFLFDDSLNTEIMSETAYAAHGAPDTTNAEDRTTGGNGPEQGLQMSVSDDAAIDGSRALIVVGVDPTATSSAGAGAGGPGGGPGR